MVKIVGNGRLTRDPEVTYSKKGNGEQLAVARFTLAVKRQFVKEGQQDTDFLPCVVFGKAAETAEKHLSKGAKVAFEGRPQSSSYKDKDGKDQFSISFLIENWEFDESKAEAEARRAKGNGNQNGNQNPQGNGYQNGNQNPQGNGYQNGNQNPQGNGYQNGNQNPQGNGYQNGNQNPQGNGYQNGNQNPQGNGYQNGNQNPQGNGYQNGNQNPQGNGYQNGNQNPQGGSNNMFSAENMGFGQAFH